MTGPGNKVLMLGLDGMSHSVMDPAFEAGHMPRLKDLLGRGVSGVLTSTVPPFTPPGWTSIFTGVNPGRHGIFGFSLGNVQRNGGLVRLEKVKAPALWNAANAQGVRTGLFNIPMTYPPPPVDGFAVSGMLTPEGGGGTPEGFTYPENLASELAGVTGGYQIDIEVDYYEDWRSTEIIERLSRNLTVKREGLRYLLDKHPDIPFLFAVLEAPDRLMHVHYKYLDPRSEHYSRAEAAPIRERAWRFFDEMDEVIGDLIDWAGEAGYILAMSDHGFGPLDKVVSINLALKEWGLLATKGGAGAVGASAMLRKAAARVKRVMPKSMWKRAKRAGQSSIDWSRTKAFASPTPQQGIYVNLDGREPEGIVPESDYEEVRDEVIRGFKAMVDPDDGLPVTDVVHRREEVSEGPEMQWGPDLFPVCRAHAYELSDGLFSPSILTDFRDLPRGFHHMDGIFGLAGPGIEPRRDAKAHLYDMAPTALYLAGLDVPEMDGKVLTELLPREMVTGRPPVFKKMDLPLAGEGAEASPYSAEEEAAIEASLRNLGYL